MKPNRNNGNMGFEVLNAHLDDYEIIFQDYSQKYVKTEFIDFRRWTVVWYLYFI